MPYLPIEDYGLIGNMRTAALVGKNGSIDWLCLPNFDSPSLFAGILDDKKGGRFQIAPADLDGVTLRQLYWPETNILITRFLAEKGVAEVIDYMPVGLSEGEAGAWQLVRRVEMIRGSLPLRMTCRPAFNYARDAHETELTRRGAVFHAGETHLRFSSDVELQRTEGGVEAQFTLRQGERRMFALDLTEKKAGPEIGPKREEKLFEQTVQYWQRWVSQCTYEGRWREQIYRSALALKLMTFEPTGAIVAAPTCSLPETIGGVRNWDYRYTWIRDAAFTVYGFLRIGFTEEAEAFLDWLRTRCHEDDDSPGALHNLYRIDGSTDLKEETLDHLEGYRGSGPVRIGNAASEQLQLDIYGELMDAVYLSNKYRSPISYDFWTRITGYVEWVCDNWQRQGAGIWEARSEPQSYTYSKLMCWVAVDRALRLATKRSFPAPQERWTDVRDEIYKDVMERGWSEERQAFVQHYESDALDASNLIMPLVFFMSPNDPRMLKTLDATCQAPENGGLLMDSLVYRYDLEDAPDGFEDGEGTFNMCTFWLVEALTRAGRVDKSRLRQARLIFEKMLGYSNHLGLYAEETGACGEALGNFPQAFTHLALISAAFNLDRTLEGKSYGKVG